MADTELFASETAVEVANKAIQVMGGHGSAETTPSRGFSGTPGALCFISKLRNGSAGCCQGDIRIMRTRGPVGE